VWCKKSTEEQNISVNPDGEEALETQHFVQFSVKKPEILPLRIFNNSETMIDVRIKLINSAADRLKFLHTKFHSLWPLTV
jgi:hypothetical protein